MRYFHRTLFQRERAGNLASNRDRVKWEMIRWIMIRAPKSHKRYEAHLPMAGLPFVHARSMREVKRLYQAWGVTRR